MALHGSAPLSDPAELNVGNSFLEEDSGAASVVQRDEGSGLTFGVAQHELWSSLLDGSELGSDSFSLHFLLEERESL